MSKTINIWAAVERVVSTSTCCYVFGTLITWTPFENKYFDLISLYEFHTKPREAIKACTRTIDGPLAELKANCAADLSAFKTGKNCVWKSLCCSREHLIRVEKFQLSNSPCRNISEMIIHIAATKLNQLQNPRFFRVMFKQLYAYTALIF